MTGPDPMLSQTVFEADPMLFQTVIGPDPMLCR
jgi:hypothetical protein